jgi:hypothetical protein
MRAFEVGLNGKRVCVAGIGDDAVLTIIANHLTPSGDTHFSVSGLDCMRNEYPWWVSGRKLKPGDELSIRVVESEAIDRPKRRMPRDAAEELKQSEAHVRKMAKQFGWKVVKRSS